MRPLLGRLGLLLWLTAVWVGLWGSLTPANVLGGLLIGAVVLLTLPLTSVDEQAIVRPLAVLRFAGYFALDLVRASLQVALLVVRPRRPLRSAVVAVPVRGATDGLLTLLANAISLTPGTLTLEIDRPRATLYVHAIDVPAGPQGVDQLRQDILRIERLAILAIGSAACRRALEEDLQEHMEVPQ